MPKTSFSDRPNTVTAVLSGDALVGAFYQDVYRLAYSILDNPEDADDAAQECFITALRAYGSFRQEASVKTWLFTIAINACRGALRKRKARQGITKAWKSIQALVSTDPSPEERALHDERDRLLWSAVNRLDDRHRLPVILHYIHGCPVPEIARILSVHEGTVHSRLHYARHRLWEQLHTSGLFPTDAQEDSA